MSVWSKKKKGKNDILPKGNKYNYQYSKIIGVQPYGSWCFGRQITSRHWLCLVSAMWTGNTSEGEYGQSNLSVGVTS